MAPDVLLRKLTYLRQLLADLAPFEGTTLARVQAEHYKVERLFELLVMTASDILFRTTSVNLSQFLKPLWMKGALINN